MSSQDQVRAAYRREVSEEIARRAPRTHEEWQRARRVMIDGVPTTAQLSDPLPVWVSRGAGAYIWDLDHRRYLDLHLGYGVMLTGHAAPALSEAITRAARRGTHFALPVADLVPAGANLCERAGAERVQLTNSGSEATLLALRLARAFTGRNAIIKVEGGYHGTHDAVMVSTHPDLGRAGSDTHPRGVTWGEGVAAAAVRDTHVVPFNDIGALRAALSQYRPAAVIMEPVLLNVGLIEPAPGYLAAVADACADEGALLIIDEVKSGLTIGWGGALEVFGVRGDLHCFGKGIAGGLPVGAVAGRDEVMDLIGQGRVAHFATFAGGPVVAAAMRTTLIDLLTPAAHAELARRAQALAAALTPVAGAHHCSVAHCGAKVALVCAPELPADYRQFDRRVDHGLASLLALGLRRAGVMLAPGSDEQMTLSLAHGPAQVDDAVRAIAAVLDELGQAGIAYRAGSEA